MATSLQGPLGDSNALTTAPLPRPPQPIKARRIVLSSAAWTCGIATPAKAVPAVNTPHCFKKSRRELLPADSCNTLVCHDRQYLGQLVAIGREHKIGIYSSIHLGDLKGWKKRRPGVAPPLQEMNDQENAALARIQADETKGKSGYQYGGEPVQEVEVLSAWLMCFHHPEVRVVFEEQIRDLLQVPGLRGIAMDYFGYRNYRCCRCPTSLKAFEVWHRQHPDLAPEVALDHFSLETLVDFVNGLARYARTEVAGAKVTCHVYTRVSAGAPLRQPTRRGFLRADGGVVLRAVLELREDPVLHAGDLRGREEVLSPI